MPTHFEERQYFRQWWIWLLLGGLNAVTIYAFVQQVFLKNPVSGEPVNFIILLLILLLLLSISVFLWRVHLEIRMDDHALSYRWSPMMGKTFKTIPWERIRKQELIQYGYIGYGTRYCLQYGMIHNVKGDKGLQFVTNQDKKYLLGTQKPKEMATFLAELGKR